MKKIESRMRESPYAVELTKDEPNRLQAPPDHGSDRYTQWISALEKPVARIPQQDYRRFFVACRRHLEVPPCTLANCVLAVHVHCILYVLNCRQH